MKKIPKTKDSLVLRTDFSDESAWQAICATIQQPVGDFRAYVDFLSDPEYDGLTVVQLTKLVVRGDHLFMFIVDRTALSHPEHPILVVDLYDEVGRTFRVIPSATWGVQNNLSIANMGFEEFADAVNEDGVFRGFPTP